MGRLKGSSSRFLNKSLTSPELDGLTWQSQYGVITFSERALPDVVSYIEQQAERHASNDLWQSLEQLPTIVPSKSKR